MVTLARTVAAEQSEVTVMESLRLLFPLLKPKCCLKPQRRLFWSTLAVVNSMLFFFSYAQSLINGHFLNWVITQESHCRVFSVPPLGARQKETLKAFMRGHVISFPSDSERKQLRD